MPTDLLHLVVDARYASDAYPGIGRVTSGLTRAWAEHPGIAALHLITNPASASTRAALPPPSARVHQHPLSATPWSSTEHQQVRALVNSLPVTWFFSPYLRLPCGLIRPRSLVMVHDAIPLLAPGIALHVRVGYALAVRTAAWRATQLVTVSQDSATSLRPWLWPHSAPLVVANGVDRPVPASATWDARAHGISGPYALCVSSNQPHKNLSTLVAAWHHASQQQLLPAGASLVIAGHFAARRPQPWQQAAAGQNPIIAIADASDALLGQLYAHAHLVVQPSLAEGYGLPVLEALAHGRVVVAHDLPVYREYAPGLVDTVDARLPATLAAGIAAQWHDDTRLAYMRHAGPICAQQHTWATAANTAVAIMQKNAPGR